MVRGIPPHAHIPSGVDGRNKGRVQSRENIHGGGDQVTLSPDGQYRLQGWVVSALFHGLALTVVLGLMAQAKPVVPKEAFKWDVALVEPQRIPETLQGDIKPAQEPAKPTPRPAVPSPSQPQMVTQEVQTREVTPVVQREIRQVVEMSQPIQQTVAVQTKAEAVPPVREQRSAEVQQATESVVESVAPVVQHEAVTAEPAITATPMQRAVTQPVTTEATVHPVEARAVETASVTRDPDLPASPVSAAAAVSEKPAEPVMRESAPQVAMATRPTPAVKVDHGWLAESLWRRVAELKRYPSSARLNGWEGKVVLRVVIRADGHLADVRIQKSSGYDALDRAALETIRLACPLHMKHELNAPEVAMNLPIVYSLAN